MEIQYCKCGSPMSLFEAANYEQCTACWQEANRVKREEAAQRQADEAAEKKRKEQEERERQTKEGRQKLLDRLAQLNGKTVKSIHVSEWKTCHQSLPIHAAKLTVETTDGSYLDIEIEDNADGCRGHYDYDHTLDTFVHLEEEEPCS